MIADDVHEYVLSIPMIHDGGAFENKTLRQIQFNKDGSKISSIKIQMVILFINIDFLQILIYRQRIKPIL